MRLICLALMLVACSPPPVQSGQCIVDEYFQNRATKQTCLYQGVVWRCLNNTCNRTNEDPAAIFPSEKR